MDKITEALGLKDDDNGDQEDDMNDSIEVVTG